MKTDVIVIGGGPAGMAAALSASKTGAKVVLTNAFITDSVFTILEKN